MTSPEQPPSISMANTKKELLEAYQAAQQRVQHLEKDLLDSGKARKNLEKQVSLATADAEAAQDPLKRLNELRVAISHELTDLAGRFEKEIETYRKIQSAVAAKQEELQTLYEVEAAAGDLAVLIHAQQTKKEQFERDMAAAKAAFEAEIREARTRWSKEKESHDIQDREEAEARSKQRQREKEEFEYSFARDKEQRANALRDELQALEKEIAQRRETFEQEMRQRKEELEAREAAAGKHEQEVLALRKEAETFPKRMETAVQAAVKETTASLSRDFEKDKALLTSTFKGEKNVLIGKIESLEHLVESQAAQLADLTRRQELAYEKVQDIANRAVEASRRESYPSSLRQGPPVPVQTEGQRG